MSTDTVIQIPAELLGLDAVVAEGKVLYGSPSSIFGRSIQSIKLEAPKQDDPRARAYAVAVTHGVLTSYWQLHASKHAPEENLALPAGAPAPDVSLSPAIATISRGLGRLVAQLEPLLAAYWIGEIYTHLLPEEYRSALGIFYTPPALTTRLLEQIGSAGIDWRTVRVVDPACGGAAFLAPVAIEMRRALLELPPAAIIDHIAAHLSGYELDPFGAWMSQILVEACMLDLCISAKKRLPPLVKIRDALTEIGESGIYDLVIGNPPYGRVTLSSELRSKYQRSVYGHANLYALFMDLAVRLARSGGLIAYVTPTGFLGGQYFQNLRALMAEEAPPVAIDLVSSRKGVFRDVLQETLLALYRRHGMRSPAPTHIVELVNETKAEIEEVGTFQLPTNRYDPWIIARDRSKTALVERARQMQHRLRDYGYRVSTGPLVWNRHKQQLSDRRQPGAYPIIWAESITRDGRFVFRTDKKNHSRYLHVHDGQDWLIQREPCILVQRTTAKEQHRRLISAELPAQFIEEYGAVSVENHLNMVRPFILQPTVSLRTLTALLNSRIVDEVFRCINGSVAVSASELESLPLPTPTDMLQLQNELELNSDAYSVEHLIRSFYLPEKIHVTP